MGYAVRNDGVFGFRAVGSSKDCFENEVYSDDTPNIIWQEPNDIKNVAKLLLQSSDIVVIRCIENSIKVPDVWVEYRNELRRVISSAQDLDLPEQPEYPQGS